MAQRIGNADAPDAEDEPVARTEPISGGREQGRVAGADAGADLYRGAPDLLDVRDAKCVRQDGREQRKRDEGVQ